MENDYRITKLHGTFIGDNRIPDLPVGEKTKIFSSTNGKTAWVDLPTDVGKDASGFAVLCHDGAEITGQKKSVKLADVRENGAIIGRDQTSSDPQTDELITKAYADKSYEGKFEVINATLTLNTENTEDEDGTLQLEATPSGEPYLLNIDSTYHVLMAKTSQGSYLGITHDGESIILVLTIENSGLYLRYRTNRFLPVFSTETNGKFLSVVDNTPTWSNIPKGASVSPMLNLMDFSGELPIVRTSITEEEKMNLEKGLYNSVLYADMSLGESGFYSTYFPEPIISMNGLFIFSIYSVSADTSTGALFVSGSSMYTLTIGEKSSDGTYPITISKSVDAFFRSAGDNGIETIEVSNGTHNDDGSYTYHLPHSVTSSPYILKTVDNGDASYYLMTGDSEISFGMRPLALSDSFFGGNFMTVDGTTATQRPTYFPPNPKSADNGKVLTVNNGYPSWETAGGAIPVVEVTSHDGSITLPEAQTTNFIIHNEEIGYIYVNNINGTYSAIIPVGKDIAYVLTGAETTITLSFPMLLNMVEGTAGELVDGKVSISIPSSHDFPFLLNIDRQGIFYISAYENNSNEIVYDGIGARKDNAGNNQLAIFSGKGTNLTMDVVPLGGGTSTSIAFQDVTVSELANHVGEFGNFHITDLKLVYDSFLGPQEFTGGYFIGTVASSTALAGVMWVVVDTQSNQTAYYKSDNFSISNGKITLQQTETLGVIKSLPFPKKINSQDGYNFLSEVIDTGSIVYAGEADIDSSSISHLILGLSSNVVPTATGDEEYCHFDCIVEEKGIGRLSLKKDANNIPQFKSFTTWLPPVTSADEGKSLVIKNGNAQWTDLTSIHNHTIVIKEGSKIIFAANKDLASATPATTLETLISTFKGTTTAGFGDYILLTVDTTAKLTKQDGTETDLSTLTVAISDTVK